MSSGLVCAWWHLCACARLVQVGVQELRDEVEVVPLGDVPLGRAHHGAKPQQVGVRVLPEVL